MSPLRAICCLAVSYGFWYRKIVNTRIVQWFELVIHGKIHMLDMSGIKFELLRWHHVYSYNLLQFFKVWEKIARFWNNTFMGLSKNLQGDTMSALNSGNLPVRSLPGKRIDTSKVIIFIYFKVGVVYFISEIRRWFWHR